MTTRRHVYLDHAAATPVDPRVVKAMLPLYTEQFYNPSALYLAAKQVKQTLAEARQSVARVLGVQPSEIIFTAGGTEANNIAIHGVMQQYPDGNVIVGALEHASVLETVKQYDHRICPVLPTGSLDLEALASLIDDKTVLVSVMHANNETGAIQPVQQIAQIVETTRQARTNQSDALPIWFHSDASQSVNYLRVQPKQLGLDLQTINGGKIYGPKQTGVLFVSSKLQLAPFLLGGGQERGLRSGTENVAGSVGLAKALEITDKKRRSEVVRLADLQKHLVTNIQEQFPEASINSHDALVNFVHVTFPGVDNERLVMELDEQGIQCAAGSACSASSDEPSHVLKAMGLTDDQAQSSVRFTMGRSTTEADIDYVLACLNDVLTA